MKYVKWIVLIMLSTSLLFGCSNSEIKSSEGEGVKVPLSESTIEESTKNSEPLESDKEQILGNENIVEEKSEFEDDEHEIDELLNSLNEEEIVLDLE